MDRYRRRDGMLGVLVASAMAAAPFAAGCGASASGADAVSIPKAPSSTAQVQLRQTGAQDPPTPFVTDRALVGGRNGHRTQLAHAASPTLFGSTSPLAVPSPDGHLVAYSAWTELVELDAEKSFSQHGIQTGDALGRPSIRVVDADTGDESLVEDGAFSVAWRADGAFAYVKGTQADYRANVPYPSEIVVRRSVDAQQEVWSTTPARYIVVAWAGDTLLAYEMKAGEQLDLLALDGPGSSRVLAADAELVAVSPDGRSALVSDSSGAMARLLDVATGDEVARLDADPSPASEQASQRLYYGGSWTGDRIVAAGPGGLIVIDASASRLAVERTLAMPKAAFPMGVDEPQFADAAGSRVTAWAPVPGRGGRAPGRLYVYVDCNLGDSTCSVGPPRGDRVFSHAYNPSRPEAQR